MKFKSLLFLTLLFAVLAGNAQNLTFTRNWQKLAGDFSWLTTTTNHNAIAYNPVTNKVYVPTRNGQIYILDPVTGDAAFRQGSSTETTLSKTGAAANTYLFNRIAVTTAGEIYAITSNPTAGANLGKCVVYYWADETSDPVQVIGTTADWVNTERAGDTFAVTGTGDAAVIYVGGLASTSTGTHVQVFAKSNGAFAKVRNIVLDASETPILGLAGYAIEPVTTGTDSPIWVSGKEYAKRKYSATGARLATLNNSSVFVDEAPVANSISKKFIALEYFEIGSKKYMAATGAYYDATKPQDYTGEEVTLSVFDITDVNDAPASPVVTTVSHIASSKLDIAKASVITNPVPSADIAHKRTNNQDGSVTIQFFQIIGRNGFGSHTITFPAPEVLPVSLSTFNAAVVNGQNQLTWTTASESKNSGFEIESSQDGSAFNKIGFVASKGANSTSTLNYSFVDKGAVSGTTYYRLKQVDLDGKFTYSDIKVVTNKLSSGVSVYPNPADDYVVVSGLELPGASIALFNSVGSKVNAKVEGNKVSLKGLTPGLYIVKVYTNGKLVESTKIVKR